MRLMILLIAASSLVAGCGQSQQGEYPPRPVKAVEAIAADSMGRMGFNAVVSGHRQIPLAFQVGGRILTRNLNNGERVAQGTLLASIDPTDYQLEVERLEAERAVATAEMATAETDLGRLQRLSNNQFVSSTDLDQATNRFNAAKGRLGAVEAALASAESELSYTRLHASYAGWVNDRAVDLGQVVTAGQPIATLTSQKLEVSFELPEQHLERLKIGDSVAVTFWSCAECATPAVISEIGATARVTTGTLPVRATLIESGESTRPGMTAWVELENRLPAEAVLVPQAAIVQWHDETAVWVVNRATNKVTPRSVVTGAVIDSRVVLTDGLKPGEWVVTGGLHVLADQQSVRILD